MSTTTEIVAPADWLTPATPPTALTPVGRLLHDHLLHDPACRRRWRGRAARHRRGTVHQAAVAQVLAEWMWDSGETPETDVLLPRRLKDKVSRALSGGCLAPQTLQVFIDAFDIAPPLADQLWDAYLDMPGLLEDRP